MQVPPCEAHRTNQDVAAVLRRAYEERPPSMAYIRFWLLATSRLRGLRCEALLAPAAHEMPPQDWFHVDLDKSR